MPSTFLTIPVDKEKLKVKLVLSIPTGAPTTLVNEITNAPTLAALNAINTLSM